MYDYFITVFNLIIKVNVEVNVEVDNVNLLYDDMQSNMPKGKKKIPEGIVKVFKNMPALREINPETMYIDQEADTKSMVSQQELDNGDQTPDAEKAGLNVRPSKYKGMTTSSKIVN